MSKTRLFAGMLLIGGPGAAFLGVGHGVAEAHTGTGHSTSYWACSPHDAYESAGGSQFSNCAYQNWNNRFTRNFMCEADTDCGWALCGGWQQACGDSDVQVQAVGGGNETHWVNINSYDCTDICPY